MDWLYGGIILICFGASVWFIKVCQGLEDKQ